MRDKNRIKPLLKKIEKLWLKNPDWRFNQLVINCGGGHFYTEDEEFDKGVDFCIEQMEIK